MRCVPGRHPPRPLLKEWKWIALWCPVEPSSPLLLLWGANQDDLYHPVPFITPLILILTDAKIQSKFVVLSIWTSYNHVNLLNCYMRLTEMIFMFVCFFKSLLQNPNRPLKISWRREGCRSSRQYSAPKLAKPFHRQIRVSFSASILKLVDFTC